MSLREKLKAFVPMSSRSLNSRLDTINLRMATIQQRLGPEPYTYDWYRSLRPHEYRQALCDWYLDRTGLELNLDDPKTFNEKIQWLKLYDSTPLKTQLADKYLVQDWIREKIGEKYLVPMLGVWDSFDEIDFDSLPNQFVLKTNHGSGMNLIVRDRKQLNLAETRKTVERWLKTNFAFVGLELQYLNIHPKIIAEKYMLIEKEYQFYCFDGFPEFISVISEPHKENLKASYDLSWKRLPFATSFPISPYELSRPDNLDEMIQVARILSKGFLHVRVDVLSVESNCFFSEMTFTPANGMMRWTSDECDRKFGELIKLPKEKQPIPLLIKK